MSIFVSIPCFGDDTELIPTIKSCIKNAKNPDEVFFGTSIIGDEEYYRKVLEEFKENKNVKISFYDYENHVGTGIGKKLPMNFYNKEDYMLQIDSHSRLIKDWDEYLINKHKYAVDKLGNNKLVLTGTPAHYTYKKNDQGEYEEIFFRQVLGYNVWFDKSTWVCDGKFPLFGHAYPSEVSEDLVVRLSKDGILPATKVSGAFIFGNTLFAENRCLDENILFYDEEISQTSELLHNGYTLVYPGELPVVSHLHTQDIVDGLGARKNLMYIQEKYGRDIIKENNENILRLLTEKDKKEKIRKFQEYANFYFEDTSYNYRAFPSSYANI
jgi:hypothetical protein